MMKHGPLIFLRYFTSVCLLVLIMMTPPAGSQTIDCTAGSQGGNFQVYLYELAFANDSLKKDDQLQNLMKRLSFKLRSRVDILKHEAIPVPILVAYCEGRKPAGEGEFSKRLVESLDDNDVILELWGQLDGFNDDGSISRRTARIYYVLVPVLLDQFQNPDKPGMQLVKYPKSTEATVELVDLLEQSQEMEAFVAVGVGINLLRSKRYDDAMKYLCKAQCILQQGGPLQPDASRQALLQYVAQSASRTIGQARSDSGYQGALKDLIDESNPCPCERRSP